MNIEYRVWHDATDPCKVPRFLHIEFNLPEEIAALNRAGTADRMKDYMHRAAAAFLAENRNYGSQLDRGRSE